MTRYIWPDFDLVYDPEDGETTTHYADGTSSGCVPGPDDEFHAQRLGITAKEHRLQHELAHHLLGDLFHGPRGCAIIWRDAHGEEQPQPEADLMEWRITALQYQSAGVHYDRGRIGALLDIEEHGGDPYRMAAVLRWMMEAARLGLEDVYAPHTAADAAQHEVMS